MDKDNQKARDELIDEEDLLNFELDDLSLEDMEKKASEFEEDIIELVDLVDKRPEESKKDEKKGEKVKAEETQVDEDQEEFGFATDEITCIGDLLDEESLDHSASNLDLAGLSLSDLNEVPTGEFEKQEPKGEISEDELEEMLEDAPTEMLDLELQQEGAAAEKTESELAQEEEPKEAVAVDDTDEKVGEVEEITKEDIKDLMEETDIEDITLDFEEEGDVGEKEILEEELGQILKSSEAEDEPVDQEMDQEEDKAPTEIISMESEGEEGDDEIISLDLDEDREPAGALNFELEKDLGISEQTLYNIEEAASEELFTPSEENPPEQEPPSFEASDSMTFDEFEAAAAQSAPEKTVGISEEVIEDIVTRVVQNVVERVTRETMIEVAEKVITEAIDALKQSLETISD